MKAIYLAPLASAALFFGSAISYAQTSAPPEDQSSASSTSAQGDSSSGAQTAPRTSGQDTSSGNDMVVAKPGIDSVKELKGKKVGVEIGLVDHLLLERALEVNGLKDTELILVNTPTNEAPQVLAAGAVDAIAAWQPNSGQALKTVQASRNIQVAFTLAADPSPGALTSQGLSVVTHAVSAVQV